MNIVLCNCPQEKADSIAKELVEKKVAACVNVIPQVKSFYHWQGELCCDNEATLIIKIRANDFERLQKEILQIHPYDVPEMVELSVSNVNEEYLKWLYANTGDHNV
ncbi:divalent-cation tolerance protein CutA [Candidatus Uabimicrobium sp. HlEnr_7]|uniref:divalent-cation tolerance protein CutA n=1 Tax=Candidatus Uabimicrobium helgolandensis TaxID=3095367 RepID=UPI0035588006